GQAHGIDVSGINLLDAGLHVAANRDDLQVAPVHAQECRTAWTAGPESRPQRERLQRQVLAAHDDVARVLPLGDGGDGEPGCRGGRQVLHTVERRVDLRGQEGERQFLDKAPDVWRSLTSRGAVVWLRPMTVRCIWRACGPKRI